MRLAHDPVSVAREGPAGDGADQGLLVGEAFNEEGDELGQVRGHTMHAALRHGPQRQNGRLLHQPVLRGQVVLEQWQEDGQQ